jgi:hypothetical protein
VSYLGSDAMPLVNKHCLDAEYAPLLPLFEVCKQYGVVVEVCHVGFQCG